MSDTIKKPSDLDTFYPESKKIKVGNREFEIKPFVLETRTAALRLISKTFEDVFTKRPELKEANSTAIGFAVIQEAGESLVELYELVLVGEGVNRDWMLKNISIADEVRIVKAISEANGFPFLAQEVQSLMEQAKKTEPKKV